MQKTTYSEIQPYQTKDGSTIRELMHPKIHGNKNQSLAEATVPAGTETFLHKHIHSEELYHITAGAGYVVVGEERLAVKAGDSIHIPSGKPHGIINTGHQAMKILCCCAPPYFHDDTLVLT